MQHYRNVIMDCLAAGLLVAGISLVTTGCRPHGVPSEAVASGGSGGSSVPRAAVDARGLRFEARWADDGVVQHVVLKITNVSAKDILIAREPDRFGASYILKPGQEAVGMGRVILWAQMNRPPWEIASARCGPDSFVLLGPRDSFTRWLRAPGDRQADAEGISHLEVTYYRCHGAGFPQESFEATVLLPEVPLLERPAGGGDVQDGTVGR